MAHWCFATVTVSCSLLLACSEEPSDPKLELVTAAPAGDVALYVAGELAKATIEQRHLVVYVGAEWCEPCRYFHNAAKNGHLDDAFANVRFLEFDADRSGDALKRAGYKSELIPLFAIPRADGRASGRQIEGSIKGEAAVGEIKPRLKYLVEPD